MIYTISYWLTFEISQVNYAINCIKEILEKDLAALEPKASAQEEFVKNLQSSFIGTVWKGGMWTTKLNGIISLETRQHKNRMQVVVLEWTWRGNYNSALVILVRSTDNF